MERRHFLVGAGGVASAAALEGCGGLLTRSAPSSLAMGQLPPPTLSDAEIRAYTRVLDRQMGAIKTGEPLEGLLSKKRLPPEKQGSLDVARGDAVLRTSLRSMLLAGSFHDLPEDARTHPAVQSRLVGAMPEMTEAMLGTKRLLADLTPSERSDLGACLREDPALGPRILDTLDREAASAGITEARRSHMRAVGDHVCFRMRQSSPLFVDEYVSKVTRIEARDGSAAALQQQLASQMGDAVFWDYHAKQVAMADRWRNVRTVAYADPDDDPAISGSQPPSSTGRGTGAIQVGSVLLGLGLLVTGIGILVVVTGHIAGAFVITAGAALAVGGLITLIVGLVKNSRS